MNKIFKVIFNRSTQQMQVVSELATNQSKVSSSGSATSTGLVRALKPSLLAISIATLFGALFTNTANAATALGAVQNASTTQASAVVIGNGATAFVPAPSVIREGQARLVIIGQNASSVENDFAIQGNKGIANRAIAIGADATVSERAVAIGDNATSTASFGVAIGHNATGTRQSDIVIGNDARGPAKTTDSATGELISGGIAIGHAAEYTATKAVAVGSDSAAQGQFSIALAYNATTTASHAVAIGTNSATTGREAVSLGTHATSNSAYGVAAGSNAKANAEASIAIGRETSVTGANSTAIGRNSSVTTTNTSALGNNITKTVDNSVFLGNSSAYVEAGQSTGGLGKVAPMTANGITYPAIAGDTPVGVVSVGNVGAERRIQNVAAGLLAQNSTDAVNGSQLYEVASQISHVYFHTNTDTNKGTGNATTNLGKMSDAAGATGSKSVTAGVNATAKSSDSISIGHNATGNEKATAAVLVGANTQIQGTPFAKTDKTGTKAATRQVGGSNLFDGDLPVTIIGFNATSGTEHGDTIIGAHAKTGNEKFYTKQNTAIGSRALAYGDQSLAFGADSLAVGNSSIALGGDDFDYAVTKIGDALGIKQNDGESEADYIGRITKQMDGFGEKFVGNDELNTRLNDSPNRTGRKYINTAALGDASIAMGVSSQAFGVGSQAFGVNALSEGNHSVAMGTLTRANGTNAIAIGLGAQALAENTISIGTKNVVSGKNSGAIGDPTTITGTGSYSLGNDNNITTNNTFVIGNSVTKTLDGSVFLGNKAAYVADNSAAGGSTKGLAEYSSDTIAREKLTFAGKVAGVVSVGDVGAERRIQNVSPGLVSANSTDAINGSQLYAVATAISDKKSYFHANPSNNEVLPGGVDNFDVTDGVGSATGAKAVTAGNKASASGRGSIAMGDSAQSDSLANIAIGENAQALTADKNANPADKNSVNGVNKAIAIGSAARATNAKTIAIGDAAQASGKNASAMGSQANVTGTESTGIGVAALVTGDYATGIGQRVRAEGQQSTAIGTQALTSGFRSTAIGRSTVAVGSQAVALGAESNAIDDHTIAAGADSRATDTNAIALGRGANANAVNAMSLGRSATALGMSSVAIGLDAFAGNADAKAAYNTAYTQGAAAKTQEIRDAAIAALLATKPTATTNEQNDAANSAVTSNQPAIIAAAKTAAEAAAKAITDTAGNRTGLNAVAIGSGAVAEYRNNVVLGANSRETSATTADPNALAAVREATIGDITYTGFAGATPSSLVSVGRTGAERRIVNVAAGEISARSTDAINGSQLYAVAHQLDVQTDTYFHTNNGSNAGGDATTNFGKITEAAGAQGQNSVTAGIKATTKENDSVAIGHNVTTAKQQSIAVGNNARTLDQNSIAIGTNSKTGATGVSQIAIGMDATVDGGLSIAIGQTALSQSTAEVSGTRQYSTVAVGSWARATGDISTAIGTGADALSTQATSVGHNATVGLNSNTSTAIGSYSRVNGNESVALGAWNNVTTGSDGSTAFGFASTADGDNSIVGGFRADVIGNQSIATGARAYAVGDGSISMGANAKVGTIVRDQSTGAIESTTKADNAIAIGNNAHATLENAVALGAGSTTQAVATQENSAKVGEITYTGFAGHANVAEGDLVSVGSAGQERQIKHVAPGKISADSTDAINGSQLYAVADKLASNMPVVVEGKNTNVTSSTTNGKTTYTVNAYNTTVTAAAGGYITAEGEFDANTNTTDYTVDLTKETKDKIDNAMSDFVVGADKAATANGVTVNKTDKRFDIVGGDNVTTSVDGRTIKVDLSDETKQNIKDNTDNIAKGFNITADVKGAGISAADKDNVQLGETVNYTSTDKNIITTVTNNTIDFGLNHTLTVGGPGKDGKDGVDGKIGVNGADGKDGITITPDAVVFNGVDGKDGKPGRDGETSLKVTDGVKGIDGNDGADGLSKTRIEYVKPNGDTETVATMNDGLYFGGDDRATDGKVIPKKLNEQLNITGGADLTKLVDNNIGVVNTDGNLVVKLVKDVDLTKDGSVTIGETTVNNNGITITPTKDGKKPVSLTNTGLDNGDNQIVNVKSGIDGTGATSVNDLTEDQLKTVGTNGANINDVRTAIDTVDTKLTEKGFNITADVKDLNGATEDNVNLGQTVNFTSESGNIITTVKDNQIDFDLADDITVGGPGKDGKDGVDGKIGVNGADGKDGITITPDAVVFNGVDGKDGKPGRDGETSLKVTDGVKGIDGNDGADGLSKTRIEYVKPNGDTETVATMNDGLYFGGDDRATDGKVIPKKLNEQLNITGGADLTKLVDNNIGVVNTDGNLVVKLVKDVDLTKDGSVTIGETTVNNNGITITPTKDGKKPVSLTNTGLDNGDNQIVNVKSGIDGTGATSVNDLTEDQLKTVGTNGANINDVRTAIDTVDTKLTEKGFNITADVKDLNGATEDNVNLGQTVNFTSESGNIITTVKDNQIDFDLADDITVGGPGKDGKDGVDGKIGVNGADGKDGITITPDAVVFNGVDGKDGKPGRDGETSLKVTDGVKGIDGNDGADGLSKTRIEYVKPNGDTETVATMNDGLYFGGDDRATDGKVIPKKLNEQLNITGGADLTKLVDNNIGVVNTDGNLVVKLVKDVDLTKDGSVTIGETTVNNNGITITPTKDGKKPVSLTNTGLDNGDNQIVNVKSGIDGTGATSVNDLTEDQLKTVGTNGANINDVRTAIDTVDTKLTEKGFNITADVKDLNGATEDNVNLGQTVNFTSESGNIITTVKDNQIDFDLADDITVGGPGKDGKDGVDGKIGVNGADGKDGITITPDAVVFNGVDGKDGKPGRDGETSLKVTDGVKGIDGNDGADGLSKTRIEYVKPNGDTETVATMNDGLYFGGDDRATDGKVIPKKLNEQLNITGGADLTKLVDNNIGVVNTDGNLVVKLVKDVDLTKDGSVTIGETTVNNNGITITPTKDGKKPVSLTNTGLDNGDNQIVNVKSGIDGTGATSVNDLTEDQLKTVGTNGANINDVRTAIDTVDTKLTEKGFNITADVKDLNGATEDNVNLGQTVNFTSESGNIITTVKDNQIDFDLADDITVGGPGKDGKDGVDGKIGVNGADGKDGITITPDAVVFNGVDGKDGKPGRDGETSLKVTDGVKGIDGNDGADGLSKTRIEYVKPNGDTETVATMNDGLYFGGDDRATDGKVIPKKLNEQLNITGGADLTKLVDNNIGVVNTDGNLVVKLVKDVDLTKDGSVTIGETTVNNNGITITPTKDGKKPVSLTNTGLDNGDNQIVNVKSGIDGTGATSVNDLTEDQLKTVGTNGANINDVRTAIDTVDTKLTEKGFNITADVKDLNGATEDNVNLGQTVNFTSESGNIITTVKDNQIDFDLADDITVGGPGKDGKDGVDGKIGVNGADGKDGITITPDAVVFNGVDGKDGKPGRDGETSLKVTDGVKGIDGNDGADGLSKTRIEYVKPNGDTETVATMNDGLYFGGDDRATDGKVIPKKLNEQLNITGGADLTKLVDNNIGVVNTDGNLVVKLVKDVDLTKDGSVTIGETTVNNNGITITPTKDGKKPVSLTNTGLDNGDNQIVNVKSGIDGTGATSVNDLTEDQLKTVGTNGANINDVRTAIDTVDTKLTEKGFNITADVKDLNGATEDNVNLGQTVNFTSESGNIITTVKDNQIDFDLADDITVGGPGKDGKDGVDGKIGVNGADGKDGITITPDAVVFNGVDGKDGKPGRDGETSLKVTDGVKGIDGNDGADGLSKTRIEYVKPNGDTETVATMNDGLYFGGDDRATDGKVIPKKLNEQLNITGGADLTKLVDNNIGVVNTDGNLVVKLVKDVDLTKDGSVTIGETTVNNNGITITPTKDGKKPVSLTNTGLDNGDNQIVNVKSGIDGTGATSVNDLTEDQLKTVGTNGANINDVRTAIDTVDTKLTEKGFNITADVKDLNGATEDNVNLGQTVNFTSESGNIITTVKDNQIDFDLADDITVGGPGKDGKDGVDGKIGVNGADGKDGITITPDAVVFNGVDGKDGKPGRDGETSLKVTDGVKGIDGNDGADGLSKTRIEYVKPNGDTETVATMNDGLYFGGDDRATDGKVIPKKLNEQLNITGGADLTKLVDNNIGVVNTDGNLVVKLVKDVDLTKDGSVTIGETTVNNNGITITPTKDGKKPVSLTNTGLDNGDNQIVNVKSGIDGTGATSVNDLTEDQLKTVGTNGANINDVRTAIDTVDTKLTEKGFNITADVKDLNGATEDNVNLGQTVNFTSESGNIITTVKDNQIDFDLADDITVGGPGKDGKDGVDGKIGVNGADGKDGITITPDAVVFNGVDGKDGKPGRDGETSLKVTDGVKGIDGNDGADGLSKTRIEYVKPNGDTETVATMNDGLYFGGDDRATDGKVIPKKLNEQLNITGGADLTKLVDNNIGVVNTDGNLVVKLVKDVDLTKDGSVTIGNTTINNDGLKIANGPSVTNTGIHAGDKIITNVTAGVADTDAVNVSQLNKAVTNINNNITESTQTYFHTNNGTNIGGNPDTNLGSLTESAGAVGLNSLAAGINAKASGANAVAVGVNAASALSSVAVGNKSKANGNESVAIGLESSSSAWRTTAIGYQAEATVESANALGNQAKATNWGATAVGTIANASGINSSAFGNNASSSGSLSLAVGTTANATGSYATAVGTLSNAKAYGAIGTGLHSYASGQNAIATGSYSVADGAASIATGWEAVATGRLTTAVGYNAKADNNQSIAVGTNSVSPSSYAISIGSNTGGLAHGAVALGRDAIAGGDAELKQKATAYFEKLDAYNAKERVLASTSPTASSYNRHKTEAEALKAELDVLKAEYDAAVEAAFTKGEYATALGAYAQAEHKDSVALGSYSTTAEAVSTNDATVNGVSYAGFAGNVAHATVSVGKEGTYRTITNVAAGRITKDSTDAINGSQLYAVANSIPATYTTVAGEPLVKIGDKFYQPTDIPADGSAPDENKAVNPADVIVSLISPNASQTANAATTLANVKSNLAPVTAIDEKQPNANSLENLEAKKNNAATVEDVLNAGWNLQNNDTAVDTVTHNDAVNFINGRGTTVSVTANDDGTVNNIQVDSALGYVNTDVDDTSTPSNTVKVFGKDDAPVQITNVASGVRKADGTAPVGQELAEAIKNATGDTLNNAVNVGDLKAAVNTAVAASQEDVVSTDGSISVQREVNPVTKATTFDVSVNVDNTTITKDKDGQLTANTVNLTNAADGKVNAPTVGGQDAGKSLVTAQTVVDAINNSGWNLAADGTVGKELINPSDTVTFKAGDNLNVKREGANITYALNENITVTSVKAGDTTINNDGLTITGGPSVTKTGINAGNKKITGVVAGVADTDAVNVSQLKNSVAGAKTEVTGTGLANVTSKPGTNGQTIYNVDVAKADAPTVARGNVTVKAADVNKVMTAGDVAKAITDSEKTSSVKAGSTALTVKAGTEDKKGNTEYTIDLSDEMKKQIAKEESVKAGNNNLVVTQPNTNSTGGKEFVVTLNNNLDLGNTGSVKMGNTTISSTVAEDGVNELSVASGKDANGNDVPTRITNVAPGVNDTDAVNVSQLKGLAQNVYGDINNLGNRIDDVDRSAKGGIASAMAFEDAPFIPGKWTYAVGAAHFGGEQAVAASLKKTADNGRWAFSGGISTASEGGTGVRIGVSGIID